MNEAKAFILGLFRKKLNFVNAPIYFFTLSLLISFRHYYRVHLLIEVKLRSSMIKRQTFFTRILQSGTRLVFP